MSLTYESLIGAEIAPYIDEIAALRIAVFREFPYLYDGTLDYERNYLQKLADSPHGYVVLARDHKRVVGASTAMPLPDADPEFQKPFLEAGLDPEDYFYFGESLMLPEYRGMGAGRKFFDEREAQADFLAFPLVCFCAVVRPDDHPARPADYKSLDGFWKRLSYKERVDLETHFAWRDLGETDDTPKLMRFWIRKTPNTYTD